MEDEKFVLVWGGVFANPETAEEFFKAVFALDVVVGMEHTDENAFSETARTDEEQVVGFVFKQRQIHGLVHIVLVALYDVGEIRHTVW